MIGTCAQLECLSDSAVQLKKKSFFLSLGLSLFKITVGAHYSFSSMIQTDV